jgi:hypothetical protein
MMPAGSVYRVVTRRVVTCRVATRRRAALRYDPGG